jgi:2-dehydro-3-deoxyphosphogluconate aldolase/(4S)-4-hydroxy-2-oxoglutarate aldolase
VIDAGAPLRRRPVFRPDVIAACHERDVPVMPGCFSPTEILAAHECGADIIKVFPATMLGRIPEGRARAAAAGEADADRRRDASTTPATGFAPGRWPVGLGSSLLDAKAIESDRFDVITANARKVVANIAAARRSSSEVDAALQGCGSLAGLKPCATVSRNVTSVRGSACRRSALDV